MRAVVFIALAVLATVVTAQVRTRCATPDVWSGGQTEVDPQKEFASINRFFYDEINQRTASFDELFTDDNRTAYHIIHLHQQKKEYAIDLRTRKCESRALDRPFRPMKIPQDAHFRGSIEIGSNAIAGAGVQVERWEQRGEHEGALITVTEIGCLPVSFELFDKRNGHYSAHWFDLTLGVADPSVFDPPRECL